MFLTLAGHPSVVLFRSFFFHLQATHEHKDVEYVYIDPHVLSNGAIADIDNDGHEELILAVSFFYDRCDLGERPV